MPTFNALTALTTVLSVQARPTAAFALLPSSSKTTSVSPDATSDTTFQVLFVKNVKMDAHIVKEPEPALFVKLEDMPTMDCAMSTAHQDQLPKSPT